MHAVRFAWKMAFVSFPSGKMLCLVAPWSRGMIVASDATGPWSKSWTSPSYQNLNLDNFKSVFFYFLSVP